MDLPRKRKDSKVHSKKDKKLKKLISKSESDSDESEHELSYYLKDRVKLMKEVLKIIKPKKIKAMAPECIQNLDNGEINSMLLEELLGISNKRLKYIFNGQNLEEDSSSTDPEAEQSIDIISLDDVTDDDFVIDLDSENDEKRKRHKKHPRVKIKEECRRKKIKKEKQDLDGRSSKKTKDPVKDRMNEQNLMSVLELLELQARARAIRSQLTLESDKKAQEQEKNEASGKKTEESDHDDAIIIESPKNIEIIITSSESETEDFVGNSSSKQNTSREEYNCRENVKKNDTEKPNSKENETSPAIPNSANEDSTKLENSKEQTKPEDTPENVENTTEKSSEKKYDAAIVDTAPDDNQNQSKNKITNIETIIISPAKESTVEEKVVKRGSKKLKKGKSEHEKPGESSEGDKAKVSKASKSEAKDDSSKSDVYKTQSSLADEGDGIILNMEQSEIDCIISD